MLSTVTDKRRYTLEAGERADGFRISLTAESGGEGIELIRLVLQAEEELQPPALTMRWEYPAEDVQASWHPAQDRNKSFKADWMRVLRANAATSAPVYSLFNGSGINRLTFAFSDALRTTHYAGAIREETADFVCSVKLFEEPSAPFRHYEGWLRVDGRSLPYHECLRDVQRWWSGMPAYAPADVPDAARRPMYSTWYSMHQNVTAETVEAECRLARSLGMDAVIVDDGWQTGDNRRGYAYAGDWAPCAGKFPDMARHVRAVHALGMKFMLWYAVQYVGRNSRAWDRFKDKLLRYNQSSKAGVLDPRYPDVRESIVATCEKAVKEWDLDGLKLDFIDAFYSPEQQLPPASEGRDYESVPSAVDRLMTDLLSRLRALKPDMMIEFRQPYTGPAMRKYGNMLRASDCPYDAIQNRVRTLDLRLLSGRTAVHADMVMWHPEEPAESAALQLINLLFAVPQISMPLRTLSGEHERMLRCWLAFWTEHRETLLDGDLEPGNPELLYPLVRSTRGDNQMVVTYYDELVPLTDKGAVREWTVVNGRLKAGVFLAMAGEPLQTHIVMRNCLGEVTGELIAEFGRGPLRLPIPASGMAVIRARQHLAGT